MLVVMKPQATAEEIQAVCEQIQRMGFRAHPMPGATRTAIGITGNKGEVEQGSLEEMAGASYDLKDYDGALRYSREAARIARSARMLNQLSGASYYSGQALIKLGRLAEARTDLRAIVGFHSGLKTPRPEDSKNIKAKVLVCLGDRDPLINAEARAAFFEGCLSVPGWQAA